MFLRTLKTLLLTIAISSSRRYKQEPWYHHTDSQYTQAQARLVTIIFRMKFPNEHNAAIKRDLQYRILYTHPVWRPPFKDWPKEDSE